MATTTVVLPYKCDKMKYRIIIVYRPPNSSNESRADLLFGATSLCKLLNNLCHSHATTSVLGDFNLPDINWSANIPKYDGVHDRL